MKYERKTEPLAPPRVYYSRIINNLVSVGIVLLIMLTIGTIGYRFATSPHADWIDDFHNASMILSGMGPVINENFTFGGKIFSSLYALFSGIVFVGTIGYALMPGIHRIFHKLHLQDK